ncbi:MAG TPA: ATP-binding protein [Candidatus Sulfotelmatobacter sp.]|nr:ATP-binding protein [Candidatus Sulfotelmatobacter sp.]
MKSCERESTEVPAEEKRFSGNAVQLVRDGDPTRGPKIRKSESIPGSDGCAPAASALRVLFVEDDPSDVELAMHALRRGGFVPANDVAQTSSDFLAQVRKNSYDVILADYRLPAWNGMEALNALHSEGLDIPVIMVSGALGDLKAVECIKQGAADYVLKDHLARLPESVRRAIGEKKLRDENRRVLEELARSNRDLEQFAYVASHDLQEPLRMVATYTQLLAERYKGKLDENADKYIHYAVDGALRMQTLVQDLLAFSRVGRGGIDLKPVDLKLVLETVQQNLRAAMEESGAQLQWDQPPVVMADRALLVQLFQNLLANALKFRGPSDPVIRVTVEKGTSEWTFSVRDNGIGIAPEHAEIIFVIFKRLHTHAEYPGSGIGLAICKKIVEQHGGRIWVESPPGPGCTFKFTLPINPKRGTYDHPNENHSGSLAGR